MTHFLEPLTVQSLKEACIARLEGLILSGEVRIGERLPPERLLAARLGVSRPVVHEALVELTSRGLVSIVPRHGAYVNDFRVQGSMAILSSLLPYNNGHLDENILSSLVDTRLLLEKENARQAALHRNPQHLEQMEALLDQEEQQDRQDVESLTELDFNFHLLVAIASGNLMYPLILNSFKIIYTNLTRQFFRRWNGKRQVDEVFAFHKQLVASIRAGNSDEAEAVMEKTLMHGARFLMMTDQESEV